MKILVVILVTCAFVLPAVTGQISCDMGDECNVGNIGFVSYQPSESSDVCESEIITLENTSTYSDFDLFVVDWGDGIVDSIDTYSNISHAYNFSNIDRCSEGPNISVNISFIGVKFCPGTSSCSEGSLSLFLKLKPEVKVITNNLVCVDQEVSFFVDNCNAESNGYFWDFGDGSVSTDRSPKHVYSSSGTYDVSLIVSNSCGTSEIIRSIEVVNDFPNFSTDFVISNVVVENCISRSSPESIVTFEVRNSGDSVTSPDQFDISFYSSNDPIIGNEDDVFIGAPGSSSHLGDTTVTLEFRHEIDWSVVNYERYFIIAVESACNIEDTNPDNNHWIAPYEGRMRDSLALVALYNSTEGASWTTTWQLENNIDTWNGVRLNEEGCVDGLDLDGDVNYTLAISAANGNNLRGALPVQIGDLTSLEFLSLYSNQIKGPLPGAIYNLSELRQLILGANELSGSINSNLRKLERLQTLNLRSNLFSGSLPDVFGELVQLNHIYISDNSFSGTLPLSFGQLVNLIELNVSTNEFSGVIPEPIWSLSNLLSISMLFNNLNGTLPDRIDKLPELVTLDLRHNSLSGRLPEGLGNIESLRNLRLSNNNFSGCFPKDYANKCRAQLKEFSDNPGLPWEGDFDRFCNGENEVGAICDDSNPNTGNDVITEECECKGNSISDCTDDIHPDYDGLMAFFFSTEGDSWLRKEGWAEGAIGASCNPCDFDGFPWYGIECDEGRVTCIDLDGLDDCTAAQVLSGNNINGPIPSQISDLSALEILILDYNNISGGLPEELYDLINLKTLNIFSRDLTGILSAKIDQLVKLEELVIGNSKMGGVLPQELGNLENLTNLVLIRNNFSGALPNSLANLQNLTEFSIFENSFSGKLPAFLPQLGKLHSIHLRDNDFFGCFPEGYQSLCAIPDGQISFDRNKGLPWGGDFARFCTEEEQINATCNDNDPNTGNDIITEECECFGELMFSTDLVINNVVIEDCISRESPRSLVSFEVQNIGDSFISTDQFVITFYSSQDSIAGNADDMFIGFPGNSSHNGDSTANESYQFELDWSNAGFQNYFIIKAQVDDKIQESDTTNNYFIAPYEGRLRDSLALIALYNNTDGENWLNRWDLSEPIDSWFGIELNTYGCVEIIAMTANQLIGQIPKKIVDITELSEISLSGNKLTGEVPFGIDKLQKLSILNLAGNSLDGEIPPAIGNLTELKLLQLNQNKFTGAIPSEIGNLLNLERLLLSSNKLSGIIPSELSNLIKLEWLRLDFNDLEGSIPQELSKLTELTQLYLTANDLTGSIPNEIYVLTKLRALLLGNNRITGDISPEIGNLVDLAVLHLYSNLLSGQLPQELGSLINLNGLDLQNNNFEGCFPDQLLTQCNLGFSDGFTLEGYNFTGNPLLPWQGDFSRYCDGEGQVGALCDDGNLMTNNDRFREDCVCLGGCSETVENDVVICEGEEYVVGSSIYIETGIYQDNILGPCDTLITTNLTVIPDEVFVIIDPTPPNLDALAYNCNEVKLVTAEIPDEHLDFIWSSDRGATFHTDSANSHEVTITGLEPGWNRISVEVMTLDQCNFVASDSYSFFHQTVPIPKPDTIIAEYEEVVIIPDVSLNDNLEGVSGAIPPQNFAFGTYSVIPNPENLEGAWEEINSFKWQWTPAPGCMGTYEVPYEICNDECEDLCATSKIVIMITPPENLNSAIPSGFTPNGDGYNDSFVIPALKSFPSRYTENSLIIMNRWGQVIIEIDNYDNEWVGTDASGADLPQATYYYIWNPGNDEPSASGSLTIIR